MKHKSKQNVYTTKNIFKKIPCKNTGNVNHITNITAYENRNHPKVKEKETTNTTTTAQGG